MESTMIESYILTDRLMKFCQQQLKNKIADLPTEYKNNSVPFGARCDISYDTGFRDGLMTIYKVIEDMDIHITAELDEMSDRMAEEAEARENKL